MMTPLAQTCGRRHFTFMRMFYFILIGLLVCTAFFVVAPSLSAQEQIEPENPSVQAPLPEAPELPEQSEDLDVSSKGEDVQDLPKGGKDLTIRSEAGRVKILKELFANLLAAPDEDSGTLAAEEIWAVFLQSGSASVDFALLRGIAAQGRGDLKLARRMFDHVMRLQPEYAEGWSRSGALALKEDDLNRAVTDTTQALILEPRHFYALWTLGNILEKLERPSSAYEAYAEANKIYPTHKEIKERVDALKEGVKGTAL